MYLRMDERSAYWRGFEDALELVLSKVVDQECRRVIEEILGYVKEKKFWAIERSF